MMSSVSINSGRRVLGDISTNALLSPSKQLSPKEHATKENTMVLPGCDTIMSLPTVAGRKRSIDEVNLHDQNHSSFTTERLSALESRANEREIQEQQDTIDTTPIEDSTTKASGIGLNTLAPKANADSSDMVSIGVLSTQKGETVVTGTSTNGGASTQDRGTVSPGSPALKKRRHGRDSLSTRSDDEQTRLIKIAAARLRDRLGKAARMYDAKEAREKAAKRAMESPEPVYRQSVEAHSHIAHQRASASHLLPSLELRPSTSRLSRPTLAGDCGGSPTRDSNARSNTEERDSLEALSPVGASHGPKNCSDKDENPARNVSIVERAIATTERGMAIDGLLKLMKTTTEYDNLS